MIFVFYRCTENKVGARYSEFFETPGSYKVVKIDVKSTGHLRIGLVSNEVQEEVIYYKLDEIYDYNSLVALKKDDILIKESKSFELKIERKGKFLRYLDSKLNR